MNLDALADAGVPVLVIAAVAVFSFVLGKFGGPLLDLLKARRTDKVRADTAAAANELTREQELTATIREAVKYTQDDNPQTREQGWNTLDELSRLDILTPEQAALIAGATRAENERRLSQARRALQESAPGVNLELDAGGQDDGDDPGHP